MNKLITATEIAGNNVYGVKQFDYTVDGVAHQDYAAALICASFRESIAIEQAAGSIGEVVQQRERKLEDLGNALAVVNRALATMKVKDQGRDDKSETDSDLVKTRNILSQYGIALRVSNSQITRETATTAQADIKYALDVEDNNLQQDLVTLKSFMNKRDNAFSTASKVISKALDAATSTIGNI